jgi:hypothetical protein
LPTLHLFDYSAAPGYEVSLEMRRAQACGGLIAALAALALAAPAARAWTPEAATYGLGSQTNLPLTMSDGTVLRTNVYYPTDPSTGQEAAGSFPVLLSQTPYGKDDGSAAGSSSLSELAGESSYLVQRGYIDVVADVRGTGGSQGEWGLFDPIQGQDGATLVDWAAKLPHADGDVGLLGASYLGINLARARAQPPGHDRHLGLPARAAVGGPAAQPDRRRVRA